MRVLDAGEAKRNAMRSQPDWIELDRRHVWHPYTQMKTAAPPIPVEGGEGVYLRTTDGKRILDGISSWWVNIHGHSHPRLNKALQDQANRLEHVIFAGFSHEPAARLAALLVRKAPQGLDWVFYSDDGSTAVEAGLKMAYQAWLLRGERKRNIFVAFDDAYHGDTFGAMAAGGVTTFHAAFHDLLFEVRRAATPASRKRGSDSPDLDEILSQDGDRVAAVIIEPMLQGAGGMIVLPAQFLGDIRESTQRLGIPLVADEIFTGFGRTGPFFACEHAQVRPDILCISKAITGGYLPLAATLATHDIYETFLSDDRSKTFFHGHSYTGNPLACAVGVESLKLFEEERRLDRVQQLQGMFDQRLQRLADFPNVSETRCLGGMAALEVDSPNSGYLADIGPRLMTEFLDRGIFLRPLGNVLYFLPPYVITDEEVHWVFDSIEEVLKKLRL